MLAVYVYLSYVSKKHLHLEDKMPTYKTRKRAQYVQQKIPQNNLTSQQKRTMFQENLHRSKAENIILHIGGENLSWYFTRSWQIR